MVENSLVDKCRPSPGIVTSLFSEENKTVGKLAVDDDVILKFWYYRRMLPQGCSVVFSPKSILTHGAHQQIANYQI